MGGGKAAETPSPAADDSHAPISIASNGKKGASTHSEAVQGTPSVDDHSSQPNTDSAVGGEHGKEATSSLTAMVAASSEDELALASLDIGSVQGGTGSSSQDWLGATEDNAHASSAAGNHGDWLSVSEGKHEQTTTHSSEDINETHEISTIHDMDHGNSNLHHAHV